MKSLSLGFRMGGKIPFSHGTKHSKGTCTLQRPNSLFSLKRLSIDPSGTLIIAKIKLGDEDLSLASVYAPCDSQHQALFTQNLCTDTVSKTNTSRTTIAGDWNTTLYSVHKRGGRQWKETIQYRKYRNSLLSFMDELDFVDVYRVLHPQKKALIYL